MLPQFGYIVAQAGADAHMPPFPPRFGMQPPPSQCSGPPNNAYRLTPPPPPSVQYVHPPPPPPKWHDEPPPPPPAPPAPAPASTYGYDLYHAPWDQEQHKLREYNDLMAAMNKEFLEHRDIIYRNKLKSLQEDLQRIQDGTHEAFMEAVSDLETERETTIAHARDMMEYQLSCIRQRFEKEMTSVDKEYSNERHNVNSIMTAVIRDKRKQIHEDRDHQHASLGAMFRDHKKRSLRNVRKRQYRPSAAEDTEKDELEQEYAFIMGRANTTAVAAQ